MVAAGANLGGQSRQIETMSYRLFFEGIGGVEKKGQRESGATLGNMA